MSARFKTTLLIDLVDLPKFSHFDIGNYNLSILILQCIIVIHIFLYKSRESGLTGESGLTYLD